MSSTSNSITWKSWSQKWGDWNAWYPIKVAQEKPSNSNRPTRKAVRSPLVMLQQTGANLRKRLWTQ